ncbi:MAG: GDSL-type esterase/lipase family protein [Acutalibacteraceae bacterium]|nr:GDSL-type esterase/lipase family protein [Acutalibacteraceae bacterium]
MKKLLSILLTVSLLFTSLAIPLSVFADGAEKASETEKGLYYKFDFSEDKLYTDYANPVKPAGHTYDFVALNSGTKVSYASLGGKDALYMYSAGTRENINSMITPLKEDGTPIIIEPGKSYSIKVEFYTTRFAGCWARTYLPVYTVADGSVVKDSPAKDSDGNVLSYDGGTMCNHSGLYYGAQINYWDSGRNVKNATYLEAYTLSDGNKFTNTGNSYADTALVSLGEAYSVNKIITTKTVEELKNYGVTANADGSFTCNGKTYTQYLGISLPTSYGAMWYEGYDEKAPANKQDAQGNWYHQGYAEYYITNITVQEMNAYVTCEYADGTTSKAAVTKGYPVEYPALTHTHKGDNVWSLSKDEYIPAPTVVGDEDITVYEYQRNIFGFENHKSYDYTSISALVKITDEFAYSGNKSARYRNVEYGLSESQPFNWTTGYTAYYTYDSDTGTYKAVTDATAPAWKPDTYYMKRIYSELEHNVDLWKIESNKTYRISFRYYFSKNSQCDLKILPMTAAQNFWSDSGRVMYESDAVIISRAGAGNWYVGELYLTTGEITNNAYNLFLRFINTANNNTTPCEVYFDEFRIEEKSKEEIGNPIDTKVYYADFENYPQNATQSPYYYLMEDLETKVEGGKTYKNNISVIDGTAVGGEGSVVKYDHLKGSYCVSHPNSLSYSYGHYNSIYPNTSIKVKTGSSYKVTFSYKAVKVDTPVKMGWFMSAYANQWTGSTVDDTLGYTIDAPTSDWVTVSYNIKFPDQYTSNGSNDCNIVSMWVSPQSDADVLIYFDNYIVQEIPTVAFVDEYGNKSYVCGEQETKIKFPESQGTRDIYAKDGTGNTVSGSNWYYDSEYLKVVDVEEAYFTKERITYFYQKYDKAIEYGEDQQSYCGFENSSVIPMNGYIDKHNNYIISRCDKGYTVDGVHTMDEWSLNGYSGFDSTNLKVILGGFMSDHALRFKQSDNAISKKMADISNGVYLEDNTSYRLSFWYRAEGESDKDLTFSFVNARDSANYCAITDKNTVTIKAIDVKSEWTLVNIDLTTDFIDSSYVIPAVVVNANINDTARTVYMDSFAVCVPVENGGVAVLKDDAAQEAGGQAMRFFYSYHADENGKVLFSGKEYEITARGILVTATESGETLVRDNENVIRVEKNEKLDECWNYENGVLTYSAYVKDLNMTESRKISARGYIVLDDGTVIYSSVTTYSLDDVLEINELEATRKDYSVNDEAVMSKARLMGANEKVTNGYTFDWNGSALVLNAKAVGNITVYLEGGGHLSTHKFTLYIDGECVTDQLEPVKVAENKWSITFNVGNDTAVRDIKFIRQQEACIGGTAVITGFEMAGELYKSEEADLLIEYLGDSITSGIGVHRLPGNNVWGNDGTNSYAFLSAQYMGADWRIRSRSGIGGYINAMGGKGVGSDWVNTYNVENCWRNSSTPYEEDRKADIVVINLGTNDTWGMNINSEAAVTELAGGMEQLITKVKAFNPDAKIIWVSGGMKDNYRESARRALQKHGGESEGYFLCDVPLNMSAGQNGHPDAKQQRIMAHSLVEFINTKVLD